MIEFALFALLVLALFLLFKKNRTKSDEVVWLDEGKSVKPFVSHTYKLVGKPDAIIKDNNGSLVLVEYKSRLKRVYLSDIVQAKSAALVMRDNGYPIKKIMIKTQTDNHIEVLPKSERAIFKEIEQYIIFAIRARNQQSVPASPAKYKCRTCSVRAHCMEAI